MADLWELIEERMKLFSKAKVNYKKVERKVMSKQVRRQAKEDASSASLAFRAIRNGEGATA